MSATMDRIFENQFQQRKRHLEEKTEMTMQQFYEEQKARFEAELDRIDRQYPNIDRAPDAVWNRYRNTAAEFWRMVRLAR